MPMRAVERIRFLFRLFLLFTFLAAVAVISAITTIKLTIQGNQETLPKLVGMSLAKAERIAGDMGLEVKVEDKLFSDNYASNDILSQEPPPETKVKAGQHVHVMVSLGPPRIVVPNLVGASIRVAQILAVEKGLTVGHVVEVHWPSNGAGRIVAQDPPAAATEIRSPAIDFLVSTGEEPLAYVCPKITGMKLQQAQSMLQAAGFSISKVNQVTGSGAPSGAILSQSPAPGSKISAGDAFTLAIAQ
ncbi:MAG: PASTA domain-containing protein [Terriglobia bacterium]